MLSCRHALCRLTILQSRLPALTRYCSDDTNNSTTKTPTKLVDEWQRPTNTELALRDAGFHGVPNDEIGKKEYAIAQKAVESALIGPESKEDSDEKTPSLNADQKLLAQVKLKSWMRSFDEQWTEENRDMILEISQLEERLKHDPHNDEIKSQTALIYESRSQEEFHRHMVRKALPGIANRYALDSKKWDKREMEVLQSELQNEIESNQMKKYAMEWFKLNPLRTQSKDAMDRSGIAPIPVRLQTLLEHIDPRLKQMNKEIGVKDDVEPSEHEMIDLSDPARVCEVLLNHGYRFNPDGSFANVNREPFALDASQRTLLRDGVNEHGDHLSGGALTQAIKKTLQLSSSSLRFKLFGMRNWAIQESRRTHSPELSTEQLLENPDLLPEKLRPTLEDLDPDAVPPPQTFSPVLDKCPLCNRPKTGVKKPCHFPPSSLVLSYTNIELLNQFVNEFGMIIPRRESGVCAKYQRKVAKAIKRAREMSLMPYNTRLVLGDRIDHQNPDMIRVAERMDVLSSSHKSSRSRYRNNRF